MRSGVLTVFSKNHDFYLKYIEFPNRLNYNGCVLRNRAPAPSAFPNLLLRHLVHTPFPPVQTVRQIAQLAVLIQAATCDLSGYEIFFGPENVSYIREGADKMVCVMGEVLASGGERGPDMNREQRHDLRNHVAVVKGFCDLILMDLPWEHSARFDLESISGQCKEFVRLLDEHRTATSGMEFQAMAS